MFKAAHVRSTILGLFVQSRQLRLNVLQPIQDGLPLVPGDGVQQLEQDLAMGLDMIGFCLFQVGPEGLPVPDQVEVGGLR